MGSRSYGRGLHGCGGHCEAGEVILCNLHLDLIALKSLTTTIIANHNNNLFPAAYFAFCRTKAEFDSGSGAHDSPAISPLNRHASKNTLPNSFPISYFRGAFFRSLRLVRDWRWDMTSAALYTTARRECLPSLPERPSIGNTTSLQPDPSLYHSTHTGTWTSVSDSIKFVASQSAIIARHAAREHGINFHQKTPRLPPTFPTEHHG